MCQSCTPSLTSEVAMHHYTMLDQQNLLNDHRRRGVCDAWVDRWSDCYKRLPKPSVQIEVMPVYANHIEYQPIYHQKILLQPVQYHH